MKAEYIDHLGTELTVVNSARCSFDKTSDWERETKYTWVDDRTCLEDVILSLKEVDKGLINYLAKNNHFTPFTHCMITVREKVPFAIARQRQKHQIGFSYNEVSRRYVDSEPEYHMPQAWRLRSENKKQGSSDETLSQEQHDEVENRYMSILHEIGNLYNDLVHPEGYNVCPEQARFILPLATYTEYYATGSLYAFARAYNLRKEGTESQKEIQMLAAHWDRIIRPLYPHSWQALVDVDN